VKKYYCDNCAKETLSQVLYLYDDRAIVHPSNQSVQVHIDVKMPRTGSGGEAICRECAIKVICRMLGIERKV
jgi:hypothetical protein